jgi:type IV pilus assembly protein PilV
MPVSATPRGRNRGFSMIEVLVSLLIIQVGLLGLVGTQVIAQRAESEAYQRAQAVILVNDIVERINAFRGNATCFAITSATTGVPYEGSTASDPNHYSGSCGVAMVDQSLAAWDEELQGSAELNSSSASVGAITGARGCVSSFVDATGATVYVVAVAWQGQSESFSPNAMAAADSTNTAKQQAALCGSGLYGSDDGMRRLVWDTVQIATLQ